MPVATGKATDQIYRILSTWVWSSPIVRMGDNGEMTARRWIPYVAGVVTFLLTLVVGGVAGTNWWASNIEMDRLVVAIEESEAAMADVLQRVDIVFEKIDGEVPPTGEDLDAETMAAVAELASIAVDGEAAISEAGRNIANLIILPWHTAILEAREAYLLHNYAWQAYMQSAQEDPVAFTVTQPLVNQTFTDAQEPLEQAIPDPALFDLLKRVQQIFVEGLPESNGEVI